MSGWALGASEHLRKYILAYIVAAILVAVPVGYHWAPAIQARKNTLRDVIVALAVLTLLPSMIQLRSERLGGELARRKAVTAAALTVIFLVGPGAAMLLAGLLPSGSVAVGFVAANSVPASSASIAYVLLAEGNIELATLLAVISIIGALAAVPAYVGLYARSARVAVPLSVLGESVAIALLTPLVVGQLARYYLVKRRAKTILRGGDPSLPCTRARLRASSLGEALSRIEDALECIEGRIGGRLKPYLSLWTMVSMLLLIATLIAAKAGLLVRRPLLAAEIIGLQLAVYAIIIAALIAATRLLRLSYEDHAATAFISLTKNESVAAAVSVMTIGTAAAIPAALIPAVQPVIAILYLAGLPRLARALGMKRASPACRTGRRLSEKAAAQVRGP